MISENKRRTQSPIKNQTLPAGLGPFYEIFQMKEKKDQCKFGPGEYPETHSVYMTKNTGWLSEIMDASTVNAKPPLGHFHYTVLTLVYLAQLNSPCFYCTCVSFGSCTWNLLRFLIWPGSSCAESILKCEANRLTVTDWSEREGANSNSQFTCEKINFVCPVHSTLEVVWFFQAMNLNYCAPFEKTMSSWKNCIVGWHLLYISAFSRHLYPK